MLNMSMDKIPDNSGQDRNLADRKATLEDVYVFGNMLKDARTKMGKSIEQLAVEFGIDKKFLIAVEEGEMFPRKKVPILDIVRVYHVDLYELTKALRISTSPKIRELEKEANTEARKTRRVDVGNDVRKDSEVFIVQNSGPRSVK